MGADLRIECDGPTGRSCRLFLDDVEITNQCHGVELEIGVSEPTKATLHMFVKRLELGTVADVEVVAPVLRRDNE